MGGLLTVDLTTYNEMGLIMKDEAITQAAH